MATEIASFVAGLGDRLAQTALNLLEGMREAEGVEFSTRVLEVDEIASADEVAFISENGALIGSFSGRRIRIPPEERIKREELPVEMANCRVVFVRENRGQGSLEVAVYDVGVTFGALPKKSSQRKREPRGRQSRWGSLWPSGAW